MSGGQKRANPHLQESISLIRAMQEANVPRFLSFDLPLFEGIIGDLYPALEIPAVDYGTLQTLTLTLTPTLTPTRTPIPNPNPNPNPNP